MKKQVLVILVCMLVIASAIIIIKPRNFDAKADGGSSNVSNENDIGINNTYIHSIAQNLSNIVKNILYPKGRSFGTPGEIYARNRTFDWMNNSGLWTKQERITSNLSKDFWETGRHYTFTSDLVVNNATLSVHKKNQNTQYIDDFYICPRWNRAILRFLGIPTPFVNMTHVFNETNLSVCPRPYHLSDTLNLFFLGLQLIDDIVNNTEIMSGNVSALTTFLLNRFQNYSNISFEDLFDHPEGASRIQGFTDDTQLGRGDYIFIGEDQGFNPQKDQRYWYGWNGLFDRLLSRLPNKTSFCYNFFSELQSQKQLIEMLLWRFCPQCKGLLLYDHNANTYDENFLPYYSLPTIYVNRSLGFAMANDTDDYSLNYTLDQTWNEDISSYNVIGQLNGSDTSKYVLMGCLYDGFDNQATADSAIGVGIMFAIGKYFTTHNITPKTNIRFVAFSGEERGGRGAFSYVDSHWRDDIPLVIDLNQLGYNQTDPRQALWITSNNPQLNTTIRIIANDTDFVNRTGNATDLRIMNVNDTPLYFSDHTPFYMNGTHDIISFVKENTSLPIYTWRMHHRDGLHHQEGDSMKYYDPEEIDAVASLILNITRYYTMNPNCQFSNITFTAFDSQNDGDTLLDSIRTNFTIHSVLPIDKVRVEMDLGHLVGGLSISHLDAWNGDYVVTNGSLNVSHIFTIPDNVTEGNYSVSFKVYNSTGRINRIINGQPSNEFNDTTGSSNWSHLYHPLGYATIGGSEQSIQNRISGSIFTATENGRADNITVYINQNFLDPARHQCMLYRANDSTLIGATTENWTSLGGLAESPWWAVFNFTGTKPLLEKGVQYMITCWGNNSNSGAYYDPSSSNSTGGNASYPYGSPPDQLNVTHEQRYYSLYCSYTPDIMLPTIRNVTETPDIVGFGTNVTISATVTDNRSGVSLVTMEVNGPPDAPSGNYTMTRLTGDTFQYVWTNTWRVGQYNYTIWATDHETNQNTSAGHSFQVSAQATCSISTLKDKYGGTQFINLTDPPNPIENLTLIGRGLTWNTFYIATTGCNILETYPGPVNYQEDNGSWTPINNTLITLTDVQPAYNFGYRTGGTQGLFSVYYKPDASSSWPVAFAYTRSPDPTVDVIRSKLVGVGYLDPLSNWTFQALQNTQNSQGQTQGDSITYPGVFTGADLTYSSTNTMLKETITMSNTTKILLQNHPPASYGLQDESSYLVFITKLDCQNLQFVNGSGLLNGNVTIASDGVDFRDASGVFKCGLPLGDAYEQGNESTQRTLTYRIIHLNGDTYLLSGLKLSDLNTMAFPVVIDPTLTVYSTSSDGYLYNSNTNYGTAQSATTGTIDNTGTFLTIGQKKTAGPPTLYYIYRGFVFFNTSALPSNAYLDSATLSLYKKDDYSNTDFDITVQNGQPTYPHDPLQSGDYNKADYAGNGGTFNTANIHNGYNNISLTSLGWVTKGGTTKLCLRSNRDINANAPTGNEYLNMYANEKGFGYMPKLVVVYRNQSKIKDTGLTNIKGYLLIQVQFYNTSQGTWVLDNDTINETSPRTIGSGSQLGLDTVFNGRIRASNLRNGAGTYRVYAAFRDPDGNVLKTSGGVELKAWWQFIK